MIPALQAVDGERVANIVATRSRATGGGLEAATAEQKSQGLCGALDPPLASVVLGEDKRIARPGHIVIFDPGLQLAG